MNFPELVSRVAAVSGYDKAEVQDILSWTFRLIKSQLRSRINIKIQDFGTFLWQQQRSKLRRHPQTGEMVNIPERLVLKFRPTESLRYMELNNGEARSRD